MFDGVEETQDWTCGEFSIFSFKENGEFTKIEFVKDDDDSGNCVEAIYPDSHMYKFYWENVGNSEYKLTIVYKNEVTSETKTEIEQHQMVFSNYNNTMIAVFKINPDEINYPISTTFVRIQEP